MKTVWLVVSDNDLGVDVHGVYLSEKKAQNARDKMNSAAKTKAEADKRVYYGHRCFIMSGPVGAEPENNWGDEDRTGYKDERTDGR